ncbi:MAG TPA: M20/M25/M40 family metallo-hydrolase [Geminicoccaceae bacterium]|nr:M20/M25/M40 family metallo-hydrolase [Geminicoccus sp.]HMU48218.1 M20/M25/M40 family metallo-hydrolase [Geminicoccaceae bacterium]
MSHADEIKAFLDRDFAAEMAFLAELVKVPSDNPPGDCAAHAARTAELLEGLGYTVERDVVPADQARANGMVSAVNLIVRRRFGDGPVIALNAHGDVVPPGEGWTRDPYGAEVVDGWMYGRGVAVSKSDIASYTWALRALEASGAPLGGTVELHFTYDEEAGGNIGPGRIMREGLSRPDLVLGAGFSYNVVTAHNGCMHMEVQVDGKSAHAAMPFTGVDALEAATHVLSALYDWRKGLAGRISTVPGIGAAQMTVGLIKGGINTNVVPDRITFRLDRRMIPEERPAEVEAELRQVVAEAAEAFPKARVEVRRILLVEPLALLPGGERLAELLCSHATAIMGEPVRTKGVPLYTDAPHYASCGVPTVLYGAGPHNIEEANAHRADERLPLSDLRKATEVIALTLLDLLTPH